jgi:hypothetical protein
MKGSRSCIRSSTMALLTYYCTIELRTTTSKMAQNSIPNLLSNWAPKWTPKAVLQLLNNGRCISLDPRRCTARLSHQDSAQVGLLLDIVAEKHPVAYSLGYWLRDLAKRGLCLQHHHQIDATVSRWNRRIAEAHPHPVHTEDASNDIADPAGQAQHTQELHRMELGGATMRRSSFSTLHEVADRVVAMERELPSRNAALIPYFSGSLTSKPVIPHGPSPLDEECPICYDDELLSACDALELEKCETGCGKTMHKDCFDKWREACQNDRRPLTCAYCRKIWDPWCGTNWIDATAGRGGSLADVT